MTWIPKGSCHFCLWAPPLFFFDFSLYSNAAAAAAASERKRGSSRENREEPTSEDVSMATELPKLRAVVATSLLLLSSSYEICSTLLKRFSCLGRKTAQIFLRQEKPGLFTTLLLPVLRAASDSCRRRPSTRGVLHGFSDPHSKMVI